MSDCEQSIQSLSAPHRGVTCMWFLMHGHCTRTAHGILLQYLEEREETPSHSLNPPTSFSPPFSHCSSLSPAQARRHKFTWRKAVWNLDSLLSYAVEMRISSSWALMQGLGVWSFIHHPAGWERPYSLSSSVSSPISPLHFPLLVPFSFYPPSPVSPPWPSYQRTSLWDTSPVGSPNPPNATALFCTTTPRTILAPKMATWTVGRVPCLAL